MLKITITVVKSIKLGYGLIIKIQIIHFSSKSHYNPGLKRKLRITGLRYIQKKSILFSIIFESTILVKLILYIN